MTRVGALLGIGGSLLTVPMLDRAAGPRRLAAQEQREFAVERGRKGETSLRAVVGFAAGTLFLRPSLTSRLYRMELRYDDERYTPRADYEPGRNTVRLGLERKDRAGLWAGGRKQLAQTALIELSPDVELALETSLGASESTFELGGLRLAELELDAGASRSEVRFSRPNPIECRSARMTGGAAGLLVKQLGNGRCRRWEVDGGVGAVDLDLAGAMPDGAELEVQVGVGVVTFRIPRDLGVRLVASRFLAAFRPKGFSRDGEVFTSLNYDRAERRIRIGVEATLGGIRVEWK